MMINFRFAFSFFSHYHFRLFSCWCCCCRRRCCNKHKSFTAFDIKKRKSHANTHKHAQRLFSNFWCTSSSKTNLTCKERAKILVVVLLFSSWIIFPLFLSLSCVYDQCSLYYLIKQIMYIFFILCVYVCLLNRYRANQYNAAMRAILSKVMVECWQYATNVIFSVSKWFIHK